MDPPPLGSTGLLSISSLFSQACFLEAAFSCFAEIGLGGPKQPPVHQWLKFAFS